MLPIFESEDDARRWSAPSVEYILFCVPTQAGECFTWALTEAQALGQAAFWLGFVGHAEPMDD